MLYYAKISGERLQDHWSSGFKYVSAAPRNRVNHYGISLGRCNMSYIYGHMCIWKTKRVPKLILLYLPFDLTALNDITIRERRILLIAHLRFDVNKEITCYGTCGKAFESK